MLAYSRADGKKLWETFIPQNGVEYVHHEERIRLGDADHRRPAGLRVVRPPRPVRVRLQRQDRLAAQVRRHRQLSRARGIAGALQGSDLPLSGCESGAGPDRVRRRVRQDDRQAALGDAAPRIGRLGHGGRDQHRRARRVDRQQPASRRGLRSGDRQGAVDRSRQHLRSDPDAGRRPRPGVRSSGRAGPTIAIRPGGSGDVTEHARRVELAARIAVRAVRHRRRRSALFDQRHAEHPDRVRSGDREARLPGSTGRRRCAKASRRRRCT